LLRKPIGLLILFQSQWKKHETRYTDLPWNDAQIAAFEAGIAQYGAELRSVREEVGTRSMPEVVRFYGKWKKYVISKLSDDCA
jgi:hypothetical protein